MDKLNKLAKENINREFLVTRLDRLRKNWTTFENVHMILLSKSVVGSENLDYYKLDCYGTTEENYLKSAAYFRPLQQSQRLFHENYRTSMYQHFPVNF